MNSGDIMQHNRKINEIIGRILFFLTFSSCIFISFASCRSLPDQRKEEIREVGEKDTVIEKSGEKEDIDVNKSTKQKMNKIEFGLKVQSYLKNGEYDASIAMFSKG